MHTNHPEQAGRLDSDRGSLIPEFALCAPFLIFGLLAIFEFGMGYREKINLASAVRSGARQASNLGDTRPADFEALAGFHSVTARAKHLEVNRVVIYMATGSAGEPVVSSCLTTDPPGGTTPSGVSSACNIYSSDQLENLGVDYKVHFWGSGATDAIKNRNCSTAAWDRFWCPTSRRANQGDPPDYLGVYANLTYTSYTRLLPSTITMTDRAVMRLEPKVTSP